jgi:hypothetical protein
MLRVMLLDVMGVMLLNAMGVLVSCKNFNGLLLGARPSGVSGEYCSGALTLGPPCCSLFVGDSVGSCSRCCFYADSCSSVYLSSTHLLGRPCRIFGSLVLVYYRPLAYVPSNPPPSFLDSVGI